MKYCLMAIVLVVSSCTEMSQFYDSTSVVEVNNREFMVRPLPGRANGFHATPNKPDLNTLVTRDPAVYPQNIRAIELHTGCVVVRESVENREQHTFASVMCEQGT